MRKKLDTRFPAARIKKIMQADEDVGKIAMAVPLLVSKALELFLQDLCDHTYEITLKRGAKTLNSLHLKQCVQSFNVFDFLRDIVTRVPDLGGSDAATDDKSAVKRRKINDEDNDSDDESKKGRMNETGHPSSSRGRGRGRGRRRGRGRGRSSRSLEKDSTAHHDKCEDDVDISMHNNERQKQNHGRLDNRAEPDNLMENIVVGENKVPVRNFDLNVDFDENEHSATEIPASPLAKPTTVELKHEEYPGWSVTDMERMAIDPIQLASLNRIDEDEEDYDEEG